jgi:hypothetical protein
LVFETDEILKYVSYMKCELGLMQSGARNGNYLEWNAGNHTHKSKTYMGIQIP